MTTTREAHDVRATVPTCRGDAIATNPDGTIKIGPVTIGYGLRVVLAGQLTFLGLATLDGRFTLTFTPPPGRVLDQDRGHGQADADRHRHDRVGQRLPHDRQERPRRVDRRERQR